MVRITILHEIYETYYVSDKIHLLVTKCSMSDEYCTSAHMERDLGGRSNVLVLIALKKLHKCVLRSFFPIDNLTNKFVSW